MKNCIFCKIISNEIDSAKIWEDNKFIAILDINPNTEGMTLVLSKEHYSSYAFDLQDDILKDMIIATKKIAKILEKSLKVKRVAMVMEGMGIDHLHIKLYPLYGLKEKFEEIWAKDKIFFEKYNGYISTQLGPQKELSQLKELAKKIKGNE